TPFAGMSAEEVATAAEPEWEKLHAQLHSWAEILRRRGIAALFRWALSDGRVPARVLQEPGGPRTLTDLGHIAQLLHSEGSTNFAGATAIRAWLSRRVDDAGAEADIEERTRRLESDADAVQVLTIHRAKGLEFPVVYCPYLWDCARGPETGAPAVYHDPERGFARMLDVGTTDTGRGFADHRHLELEERRAEDLRLLYVALTRAQHQLVLWWVRVKNAEQSPLYRVLAGRRPDGSFEPRPRQARDAEVDRRLQALAESNPGCIAVERCSKLDPDRGPWPPAGSSAGDPSQDGKPAAVMEAAAFTRDLDLAWRRTSYTSIVSAGAEASGELVASEPESSGKLDESHFPAAPAAAAETQSDVDRALRDHGLPLAEVPSSAGVGTFVHRVLERVDFTDGNLDDHVGAVIASEWERRPPELNDPGSLAVGLAAAIRSGLGPLAGGGSLRDIARADRLDEVGFELPLAGGDSPRGAVITAEIARLFTTHIDANGPLRGYGDRLANPSLATNLRGYLTGSLDLVFRKRMESKPDRYYVADYKTNRLSGAGEVITAWHYRPDALDAAMQHAHYPLQAILYTVALHRYLRWRLSGYDPERNIGGVLYLFLRGMTGPDCPVVGDQPCGVFSWKPPSSLVVSLSDLFDKTGGEGDP
ncbi:MAG TPA: 3'-5' exonuclease, partial [Acidimicrobiales bacterium]|nr:3'-5' exonuclease [Acidimicrobiales bacterium]